MQEAVATSLMCQWENLIHPCPEPTIPISWTPSASVATWDDTNGAGQTGDLPTFLATADIDTVTLLDLSFSGVTAIEHVEYLTALEELYLNYTGITSLDLSCCGSLLVLEGSYLMVTSLKLPFPSITHLERVTLSYIPLTTLDFTNQTHLSQLSVGFSAALTNIILVGVPALQSIVILYTPITSLVFDSIVVNNVLVQYCSLTQASEDAVACALDASGVLNGTLQMTYNPGGPLGPAGLVCAGNLAGNGWVVTVA